MTVNDCKFDPMFPESSPEWNKVESPTIEKIAEILIGEAHRECRLSAPDRIHLSGIRFALREIAKIAKV